MGVSPLPSASVAVTLSTGARRDKYGVVMALNPDGSVQREYKITEQELATLHQSGNGWPPGVTQKEWESGLACVVGKGMDTGDVAQNDDGSLLVKIDDALDAKTQRFVEKFVVVKSGDYLGIPPLVTAKVTASLPIGVTALVAGVLTVDPSLVAAPVPKALSVSVQVTAQ
jgi:regulator of protease activity HflC (stomatin/prohibitin superfamily)